ncbi:MAG: SEL1-like repeat protein [Muribaculaceae bacterium]|nr:SEL1-like repeat protein [Muribaculaceae bacterium]
MKKFLLVFAFMALAFSFNADAQSIQELRDSMAMGNLNCQVDLAIHYIYGDSVEQDNGEALRLIKDAALKGNRYGELVLGMCYDEGTGVVKDSKEAFKWYLSSAQKGNTIAKYMVASSYENGEGVEANPKEAFRWYKDAADNGHMKSQVATAVQYEHGNGVEQDWKESFRYMKMAVDNEDATDGARYLLAKYYFNGWGTDVDRDKALKLLVSINDDRINTKQLIKNIEEGDTITMYEFQFRLIPSMVWDCENGDVNKGILNDVTEWQLQLGSQFISHYEWDWKDISSNVHHPNDSIEIIVYRFPEPERMPLCLYSAAVINTRSGECAYYTLEKTMNFDEVTSDTKCWVFGGMSRNNASHVSYDMLTGDVTEQQFVDFILAFLSKSSNHSKIGETVYPTKE